MAHDTDSVSVQIHEFKLPCHLGCIDEERARLQVVAINLEAVVSVPGAQLSDNLRDCIDYRDLIKRMELVASEQEWKLLEKMTFDLATDLLVKFPPLQKVKLSVRKNVLPGAEGVTVTRTLARYN